MSGRAFATSIFLSGLVPFLAGCSNPSTDQADQAEVEASTEDVAALPDEDEEGESEEPQQEGYSTLPPQRQQAAPGAPPSRGQAPAQRVGAGARGDAGMFYDTLDRDGVWVRHPDYSYVWIPTRMGPGWRPYQDGRWIWTDDYGWYWESEEPFAWAVYHYGRWDYDPDYGWFWVPGDIWAPAWVTWRYGGDTVGWAPIAPDRPGFARGMPRRYDPPVAESWVFVQARNFGDDDLAPYVLPPSRIGPSLAIAMTVGSPRFEGGRVFNPGAPRGEMQRYVRRPIQTRRIVSVGAEVDMFDDDSGLRIGIYRPAIAGDPAHAPRRLGNPGQSGRVLILDFAGPGPSGRYDAPSAALLDVLDRRERQSLTEARLNAKQAAVDARIDQLRKERAALVEQRRKEAKKLGAKLEKERQQAENERRRNREIVRAQKRERAAAFKPEQPAGPAPSQPDQAGTSPAPQPAPVIEVQPEPAAPAPQQAATPPQPQPPAAEAPPPSGVVEDAPIGQAPPEKEAVAAPDPVEPAAEAEPSPQAVPPEPAATGAVDEAPREKKKPQKLDAATGEQPPQALPADTPPPPPGDAAPQGNRKKAARAPVEEPAEAAGEPAASAPPQPAEIPAPAVEPPAALSAERAERKPKRENSAPPPEAAMDVAPLPGVTGLAPEQQAPPPAE